MERQSYLTGEVEKSQTDKESHHQNKRWGAESDILKLQSEPALKCCKASELIDKVFLNKKFRIGNKLLPRYKESVIA